MRIKIKKNKKILIIVLVCVGMALVLGVLYHLHNTNNSTEHQEKTATEQLKDNDNSTKDSSTSNGQEQKTTATNSDPQAQTTVDQSSGKTVVSVVTSVDVVENTVYIRGGINNVLSEGVCKAFLKHSSGKTVEKETSILANTSTVDCKTIQIPTSELLPGVWTYTLKYISNTAEGASGENSFQIN